MTNKGFYNVGFTVDTWTNVITDRKERVYSLYEVMKKYLIYNRIDETITDPDQEYITRDDIVKYINDKGPENVKLDMNSKETIDDLLSFVSKRLAKF